MKESTMRVASVEEYIRVLSAQAGWIEWGSNGTPFGPRFKLQGQPWCAMFLAAVAEDVFDSRDVVPWTASTSTMVGDLKALGRELPGPQVGAVAYRARNGGGHVGIVTDANAVATVEGNSNSAGSATGGMVVARPKPAGPPWQSYWAPLYPVPPAGLVEGMSGPFVADLQRAIGAPADGEFGAVTKAALVDWQKDRGLTGAGVWGPKSVAARVWDLTRCAG